MTQPTAILMADPHIEDRNPPCRVDNYLFAQGDKWNQIKALQRQCSGIPVLCAGDIFHRWNPRAFEISFALNHIPDNFYVVPGNHDLPSHSILRYPECGLAALEASGKLTVVRDEPMSIYGMEVIGYYFGYPFLKNEPPERKSGRRRVAVIHEFAYKGRAPFPGATGRVSKHAAMFLGFDLVLCGDNHQTFTHQDGDLLFVNPGSLTRHVAVQIRHRPCVYLYYADDNRVEPIFLEIDPAAVQRDHIDIPKERSERIKKFADSLNLPIDDGTGPSFEDKLEKFLNRNEISDEIVTIIMEAVHG